MILWCLNESFPVSLAKNGIGIKVSLNTLVVALCSWFVPVILVGNCCSGHVRIVRGLLRGAGEGILKLWGPKWSWNLHRYTSRSGCLYVILDELKR